MNDWNAFGLRATDSHTISVHAAFVPNERTFSIMEPHAEFQHRLYDYPFGAFAAISFAAVTLGIGRHFLDEAEGMLNQQRDAWETARPGRAAFMEYLINEGRCAYTEAKRHYKFHVECSWNELMEQGSVSQQM
ncbi:acyl-CoA dehydrogenase, partial [Clostridium perfringens]|nr:acyl-CoA dehydrogenase [Clostridium perfringens]